ncbi:MAG: efflux RND transporter periplasmic adaptor subunit [Bacteroidia bacterium]
MSKRTVKIVSITGLVLIILAALIIPKIELSGNSEDVAAAGPGTSASLPVRASIAKDTLWNETIDLTGNIIANEIVELRSEIAGKVSTINFEEGQRVQKGRLLVKIRNEEVQAELQKLRYQIKLAEDREYRQEQLLERGGISEQTFEQAQTETNTLKAEVARLTALLDKSSIRAPFAGVIGLRHVSPGSYISPNTLIATLVDADPVKIDFSIPEKYAASVNLGDKIKFSVPGSETQHEGEVYAMDPQISRETRTLQLRARADNPDNKLLPGGFANVELVLGKIENAVFIPSHALISEIDGQKVFLYKNGKVAKVDIQTGIRTAENIQVTSGIKNGDTIITTGLLQIRPGVEVKISELR